MWRWVLHQSEIMVCIPSKRITVSKILIHSFMFLHEKNMQMQHAVSLDFQAIFAPKTIIQKEQYSLHKKHHIHCQWKHNKQATTTCEMYLVQLRMPFWIIIAKIGISSLPKVPRSRARIAVQSALPHFACSSKRQQSRLRLLGPL